MKTFLFIVLTAFCLFSCADFNRDQLLSQVDKLEKRREQLQVQLEMHTFKDVAYYKNNMMQTELRIKQNLYLDTINLELAQQLESFKLMRKSINPLMKQYLKAKSGVKEEFIVLKNLRRDIEEGRGERHRYNEYIRFEKQKMKQLEALSKDYLHSRTKFLTDYKHSYPAIHAFSLTLKQKQRN